MIINSYIFSDKTINDFHDIMENSRISRIECGTMLYELNNIIETKDNICGNKIGVELKHSTYENLNFIGSFHTHIYKGLYPSITDISTMRDTIIYDRVPNYMMVIGNITDNSIRCFTMKMNVDALNLSSEIYNLRPILTYELERIGNQWEETFGPIRDSYMNRIIYNYFDLYNISPGNINILNKNCFIGAGRYSFYPFEIPWQTHLYGNFTASGDSGNNIEVLIIDKNSYSNWYKGLNINKYYDSGKTKESQISVTLPAGNYFLIYSNQFDTISTKIVATKVDIIY